MSKLSFTIVLCLFTEVLFSCSVEAVQFECSFQILKPWITPGDRYTCNATVINSGSSSFLESVTGNHQTEKSNDDVQFLRIYNQVMKFVPEGIADFFKNVDALQIMLSSLMSISANDLRQFPRLLHLDLSYNRLTSIDGDLFIYTPNLQYVEFDFNRIEHIGQDLVTNLNNLTYLRFDGNICISQVVSLHMFVLLLAPQLTVLCPPLNVTTITTTAEPTITTDRSTDQCFCDEEIEKLHELNRVLKTQLDDLQEANFEQNRKIEQQEEENQQQNRDVEQLNWSNKQLIDENAAFEKRLLGVEKKLSEVGSSPCSN